MVVARLETPPSPVDEVESNLSKRCDDVSSEVCSQQVDEHETNLVPKLNLSIYLTLESKEEHWHCKQEQIDADLVEALDVEGPLIVKDLMPPVEEDHEATDLDDEDPAYLE